MTLRIKRLILKLSVLRVAFEVCPCSYTRSRIRGPDVEPRWTDPNFFSLSQLPSIHRRHFNINLWYSPSKLPPQEHSLITYAGDANLDQN